MNKAELIERIASETGIPKVEIAKTLSSFTKITTEALANDEKVVLTGFGTFQTVFKQGRVGRNPRTGESIKIEPKKVAKFKPSQELNNTLD